MIKHRKEEQDESVLGLFQENGRDVEKFAKLIRKNERFLITTHLMPDGDGLGSEMALHLYLKKVGKYSTVLNLNSTPEKFQLVDPRQEIQIYSSGQALPACDVIFVLDTSDWRMLGAMAQPIQASRCPVIFVDHHVPEIENIQDHLIDERFSSTGELIYGFLRHLRADIDQEIALAIYVSIVTDTGGFRHKRTSPKSHRVAAELLQKGISPESVHQLIYGRDSFAKVRLLGHVLEGIQSTGDGRVAWLVVSEVTRKLYRATIEDTESFVNQLTLIEGVDIGILFREDEDGRIKVSLRGKGEVPVIGIAKKFGGGGHRHAAGAKVSLKLQDAIQQVCQEASRFLAETHPKSTSVSFIALSQKTGSSKG